MSKPDKRFDYSGMMGLLLHTGPTGSGGSRNCASSRLRQLPLNSVKPREPMMIPAHLNKKAPPKRGLRRLRDVPPRKRARHLNGRLGKGQTGLGDRHWVGATGLRSSGRRLGSMVSSSSASVRRRARGKIAFCRQRSRSLTQIDRKAYSIFIDALTSTPTRSRVQKRTAGKNTAESDQ